MKKEVWGPAVVIPLIVVPLSIAIFVGIMIFLELFHDYALALGTIMFVGISAAAWVIGRRTETQADGGAEEATE